jgi:hypothetical protein
MNPLRVLRGLSPRGQRIATVTAAVGVGLLGLVIPGAATITTAAALTMLGWAAPHPADRAPPTPAKQGE